MLSAHWRSSAGADRVVTRRAGAKRRSRRLDDSVGGGDSRELDRQQALEPFDDWRRYRSAFDEAIGLLAMSEHLSGVTMTVQLAVSLRSGEPKAVISGQDLEFHVVSISWLLPRGIRLYATRRCSP